MSALPRKGRKIASFKNRRENLKEQLKDLQAKLIVLEEKRKIELGSLLVKHGLGEISNELLEPEIVNLSKKLVGIHSNG